MMSFYEWILMVERYSVKAEQRKVDWETGWDQTRRTMAMLGNMFRGEGSQPLLPTDIIRLSFDTSTNSDKQMTPDEIRELVTKRFGSKLNRKRKGGE